MSSSIPLTSAVTSGDENAVSASLANGADVNERTGGGQTALILAVIYGHTNIVRILVQAGADPQQRDNLGLNAIDWAHRRGSTDALDVLTNTVRSSTPPRRILINLEEPEKREPQITPPPQEAETRESISEAEKSQRWVTGLKQRLDEQAIRQSNRNEPPPQPEPIVPEPEPVKAEPPAPEPVRTVHSSRILTPPPETVETGKKKRCPQCNAIYNGDLVSYCAYHTVRLVDADAPIIPEPPPKSNPPLFWIMVIITLTGSIIVGSIITAYLYKSNQAAARTAAEQQQQRQLPIVQKGLPEVGGDLVGKVVSLPEAECPVRGPELVSGTVTVSVMVDRKGQVQWARGSGGDWLMRGAATEAAMKSTFAPEKLRRRETEGTITYTFKP